MDILFKKCAKTDYHVNQSPIIIFSINYKRSGRELVKPLSCWPQDSTVPFLDPTTIFCFLDDVLTLLLKKK